MDTRRDQIVEAARRLLAADPESSPTVRAVALEAGIGASTLRHYFPTQRALREAVLDRALEEPPSELAIRDSSRPPAERLTECLLQLLPPQALVEELPFSRWAEALAAVFGPDATAESRLAWAANGAQLRRRVAGWLAVLAEEGAVAPGSEERSARLLMTVVDGLATSRILPVARHDAAEELQVLDDAVAAVLRGRR
ncbi:TetR/AcrR family transcriptional regulator [Serinibacter arcticus]|uniref:TetR/AcrR family transcriptional regulator n=1 Tax=Serinibacter arcticus TaxID=1655435 RepID=UPI0013049F2A|nr:TetR/AcrR family transcriptional regulator [Serinibacter arcticus]